MIDTFEGVCQHVRDIMVDRDFRESRTTYERFGLADSDSLAHNAFAVGYLSAIIQGERHPGRGRPGLTPTTGTVGIRFSWELSAKAEVRTYDVGLSKARSLASGIVAGGRADGVHLMLTSLSFSSIDGWFAGEIILSVRHNTDLTM